MTKPIKVVTVSWMDIVEGKQIDDSQRIALKEALQQIEQREEQERFDKEKRLEELEELRLQHQIEELTRAYVNKDYLTCLELIVERMGGTVEQNTFE